MFRRGGSPTRQEFTLTHWMQKYELCLGGKNLCCKLGFVKLQIIVLNDLRESERERDREREREREREQAGMCIKDNFITATNTREQICSYCVYHNCTALIMDNVDYV